MNTKNEERAGLSVTNMVNLVRGFAMRFVSGSEGDLHTAGNELRGHKGMASAASEHDNFIIIRTLDDGKEHRVSKADFIAAVTEDQFTPGVEVVDSDIAADKQFQKNIEAKLTHVGNHCFGDVGAELERNPEVSESSLAMIDAYFANTPR